MNQTSVEADKQSTSNRFWTWRALVLAGVFHAACTLLLFIAGRTQLFPSLTDQNGIAKFPSDSPIYLLGANILVNQIKEVGISALFTSPFSLHTKIYSILFVVLGPVVGHNIVAAEPFNVLCYVAIVFFVFKLGQEVFGTRTGRVAAVLVAFWPTLLLHTTQFLREHLFIALLLGFILLLTHALTRTFSTTQGIYTGLLCVLAGVTLWIVRPDHWPAILLIVFIGTAFQVFQFFQTKKLNSGNVIRSLILLLSSLAIPVIGPHLYTHFRVPGPPLEVLLDTELQRQSPVYPPSPLSEPLTRVREQIAWTRYLFATYRGSTSNIDQEVRFDSWGAVIRYVPRAAEVGLFAPFPNMWFAERASVGRAGRILSGVETLVFYFLIGFAFWCLWKRRDQLVVWFLMTSAVVSVTLLALVVANVGALYRMRYPYWTLLLLAGVDGVLRFKSTFAPRSSHQHRETDQAEQQSIPALHP